MDMTSRIKSMTAGCRGKQMAQPTIATGFARAFLEFAVAKGADREALIERSRLRPQDLTEPDNRIALATYLALMEAGIELCEEPALALLFGAEVSLSDISILGLVGHAATSSTSSPASFSNTKQTRGAWLVRVRTTMRCTSRVPAGRLG